MGKEKRIKGIITMPAKFWTAIDNRIDDTLISSRGDAVIDLILDMQLARPDSVKFDEMITIKMSEYQQIKGELAQLREQIGKPPQPQQPQQQIPKDGLEVLNVICGDLTKFTGTKAMIIMDEFKTMQKASEMLRELRRERDGLKKRIAELEGMKS